MRAGKYLGLAFWCALTKDDFSEAIKFFSLQEDASVDKVQAAAVVVREEKDRCGAQLSCNRMQSDTSLISTPNHSQKGRGMEGSEGWTPEAVSFFALGAKAEEDQPEKEESSGRCGEVGGDDASEGGRKTDHGLLVGQGLMFSVQDAVCVHAATETEQPEHLTIAATANGTVASPHADTCTLPLSAAVGTEHASAVSLTCTTSPHAEVSISEVRPPECAEIGSAPVCVRSSPQLENLGISERVEQSRAVKDLDGIPREVPRNDIAHMSTPVCEHISAQLENFRISENLETLGNVTNAALSPCGQGGGGGGNICSPGVRWILSSEGLYCVASVKV